MCTTDQALTSMGFWLLINNLMWTYVCFSGYRWIKYAFTARLAGGILQERKRWNMLFEHHIGRYRREEPKEALENCLSDAQHVLDQGWPDDFPV